MKILIATTFIILSAFIGWYQWTLHHVELFVVNGADSSFKEEASKIAKYVNENMAQQHNLKIVYPLRIIIAPNNNEYRKVYQTWTRGEDYEENDLLGSLQNHFPKLFYRHNIVVVANDKTKGLPLTHAVIHEMIHSYQFSLGHNLENGAPSAWENQRLVKKLRWFTEGACDVIAAKMVASYGFPEDEKSNYLVKTIEQLKSKQISTLPKLSQLNSDFWDKAPGDRNDFYALGRLAVMRLEERYGEAKIFQYYVELNHSKNVSVAFEKAFGLPLAQYEASFENDLTQLLK